ncbi:MAG: GntR family transcriptional regulator [Holophagaceae bacterium]|nr:GntR family transcriptional regulator [Holophagaceae bacterium]
MAFSDLSDQLDPRASEPLALQLARLLAAEISRGRLAPGEALPGSRALAQSLGLSRHVVMSALWELEMEGWTASRHGSGTYVADVLPATFPASWGTRPAPQAAPENPPFELSSQLRPVSTLASGMLDLSEGYPDARLAPREALARGYQRALQRHGDDLLGKGEPRGNQMLREQLAIHLRKWRGLTIQADNLLITRGIPMSLALLTQALGKGDFAMEDPGDPLVREALDLPGARLHPLPVDHEGLCPEALAALAQERSLAFVHLTPRRQVPTTVPLSPVRREQLAGLAQTHGFALVEEDTDAELTFLGEPSQPMAAAFPEGHVIHLGSLSQLLAPGLCLAYLVAPAGLVDRLARLRQRMDTQGDRVLEWAMADLIRDGDLERHLARTRKVLKQRREVLEQCVGEFLGPDFRLRASDGGQACWMETPPDLDLGAWAEACHRGGVKFHPPAARSGGLGPSGIRLGFAHLDPSEIRAALETMGRALGPRGGTCV